MLEWTPDRRGNLCQICAIWTQKRTKTHESGRRQQQIGFPTRIEAKSVPPAGEGERPGWPFQGQNRGSIPREGTSFRRRARALTGNRTSPSGGGSALLALDRAEPRSSWPRAPTKRGRAEPSPLESRRAEATSKGPFRSAAREPRSPWPITDRPGERGGDRGGSIPLEGTLRRRRRPVIADLRLRSSIGIEFGASRQALLSCPQRP